MKFYHEGKPLVQQRHRMAGTIAYDPQARVKKQIKADFTKQFNDQGYLKPIEGAIMAIVDISHQIPQSWSKKRQISVLSGTSNYVTSKVGDVDNICKIYFDILNQLAYNDDSQIVALFAKKTYSKKPGVNITLLGVEDDMIKEHALSYKDDLSESNLDYLTKKANLLGLSGRQIIRAYLEDDTEGKHVYFAVDGIKEKTNV
jgi:Holliday junction resolvase RusA-like endonuclease